MKTKWVVKIKIKNREEVLPVFCESLENAQAVAQQVQRDGIWANATLLIPSSQFEVIQLSEHDVMGEIEVKE